VADNSERRTKVSRTRQSELASTSSSKNSDLTHAQQMELLENQMRLEQMQQETLRLRLALQKNDDKKSEN